MTNDVLIGRVAADAQVYQANVRVQGTTVIEPTPDMLRQAAANGLESALSELVIDPSVKRAWFVRTYSLTPVAGTEEYTLPLEVGRILPTFRDSDSSQIRAFDNETDFRIWRFNQYGGTTVNDSDDPTAYYVSGFGPQKQLKITFFPGVGSQTTIPIRHERRVSSPLTTDLFPDETHGAILIGAKFHAGAKSFEKEWLKAKRDIGNALQKISGGISVQRYGRATRHRVRRINHIVSGTMSPWPFSVKDSQ